MKVGVVVFPGTNCDKDTLYAFEQLGCKTQAIWHQESALPDGCDLVVLPGGFSYGDYLRSGSIARFSPIMQAVAAFAQQGGMVLGICNGFQILLEAKLLPGAMKKNQNVHFVSKYHALRVVSTHNKFLSGFEQGAIISIPIAHGEGNYFIDPQGLHELYANDQVLLTYCDARGNLANPNGSVNAIAGICNTTKNVFGLMPHPERACETLLGSADGVRMLEGLIG